MEEQELDRIYKSLEKGMVKIFSKSAMQSKQRQSMDLVYSAWEESNPRKAIALAKRALELAPDNVDACNVIAGIALESGDLKLAKDFYQLAVQKAIKQLGGKDKISRRYYHFWGELRTRPFMRALQGLGLVSLEERDYSAACEIFEKMIKLNPNDNQGIRYLLGGVYCSLKEPAKMIKLDRKYNHEREPHHLFNLAHAYFQLRDIKNMFKNIYLAFFENIYIAPLLLGKKVRKESIRYFTNLEYLEYAEDYIYYWGGLWEDKEAISYLGFLWLHSDIQQALKEFKKIRKKMKSINFRDASDEWKALRRQEERIKNKKIDYAELASQGESVVKKFLLESMGRSTN